MSNSTTTTVNIAGLGFVGWLFTLAYCHLAGWPVLWAVIVWPYYLGNTLAVVTGVR
jgi:hypothetical protein